MKRRKDIGTLVRESMEHLEKEEREMAARVSRMLKQSLKAIDEQIQRGNFEGLSATDILEHAPDKTFLYRYWDIYACQECKITAIIIRETTQRPGEFFRVKYENDTQQEISTSQAYRFRVLEKLTL